MSQLVLENVLPQIDGLDVKELRRLQRIIDAKLHAAEKAQPVFRETSAYPPGFVPRIIGEAPASLKDRSRENEWVARHRDEYANQWVALDGDRLLSHGPRLKEVLEAARAAGVNDALLLRLEPSDAPLFAGSQLCVLD